MQCPRCHAETKSFQNHNISIDVCHTGCGGIWFDWQELKKMDENHEADPQFLAQLSRLPTKRVQLSERTECPHCDDMIMMRRFWSVKRQVEIDECPKCGGIWLDAGELTHIYSEFKTDEDRVNATDKFINDMFGSTMELEKIASAEKRATVEKIGKVLDVIAPGSSFRRRRF